MKRNVKLILKPNRALVTSKRQADLIKGILRQNLEQGIVNAREEKERTNDIDRKVKFVCVRLEIKNE